MGEGAGRHARSHPAHAYPLRSKRLASKGDFSFIERQRGMFSYSGLDVERVRKLRSEFGLYIVDSGRICVAALN